MADYTVAWAANALHRCMLKIAKTKSFFKTVRFQFSFKNVQSM